MKFCRNSIVTFRRFRLLTGTLFFLMACLSLRAEDRGFKIASSHLTKPTPSRVAEIEPESASLADLWGMIKGLKRVHPLLIAATQLILVLGICLLLTDNRELEKYLKIDLRPPRTDILN